MAAWRLGAVAAGALLAGLVGLADARMHYPARGHRILPAGGIAGVMAQPSGAYSFRKLVPGYAGFAVQLQRVDTTTQNIGFTASGDFDTAAATTFCTTACTVRTWYDQSGLGRDLQQATAATQLNFVFNCNGALPCARALGVVGQWSASGNVTPATGVLSLSAVGMLGPLGAGSPTCHWMDQNGTAGNRLSSFAAGWFLSGGGTITAAPVPAVNVWHTQQGVVNGAASVLNVDGVETAGSLPGTVTAAGAYVGYGGTTGTVCSFAEAIVWDNYVLTPAERVALTNNQRNYWTRPLDAFTAPAGAYSFRRLLSAYAGPAIRIRRASDDAQLDINFLSCTGFTGCPWDEAAATAHCASTTCFVVTQYDQSGNARHLTQATPANQPALILGCQSGIACLQTTDLAHTLAGAATVTPATGIASFSAVANRTAGAGICTFIRENGNANRVQTNAAPDTWRVVGGASGTLPGTATDNQWHSFQAVLNGASSVINIDGTETAGTTTGNVTAGVPSLQGGTATTCRQVEEIFWDNYQLTAPERTFLIGNQRSFWGTP